MKPLLLFQAPVQTRSGYGEHARDLLHSLIKMDKFDIRVWGTRWGDTPFINLDTDKDADIFKRLLKHPSLERKPDIYIQVTIPQEFQQIGKFNIGITAGIETTHCSSQWIEGLNRMDLIIVPSKHSKDVFLNTSYSKVDENTKQVISVLKNVKPIEVLFEGVDTSIYKYDDNVPTEIRHLLNSIPESFAFLFVGHWLKGDMFQDRKDVSGLIKTFLETFKKVSNPPALILKTSIAAPSIIDRNMLVKNITMIKGTVPHDSELPNIYILHGDLTPEEMNGLYNHSKIKAHISFTKGEGFGRPLLEASLSRKPIIASNWSGHLDFLNKQFSILLPGQLRQVHPSAVWEPIIIAQSSWFNVNYQVASNVMMNVWKQYPRFKDNAIKQAMYSEQNFSFVKMQELFKQILDKYLPEFPKEVEVTIPNMQGLKLPKLKPLATNTAKENMEGISADSPQLPKQKEEEE